MNPIVNTEYGVIEGLNYKTPDGIKMEMFLGIPYAKPPINELRFEKPLPPIPWKTLLQAKALGLPCATSPDLADPNGNENCLTLNIIKPGKPCDDPNGYPIMLWIHGGGFIIGSSADFNHEEVTNRLVSQGIIFISINYRLGPFGFFTTGDSLAPGNYGLWDQIEALKFVQKVIGNFGGNPKAVTIFGVSAGGASVSWLTMSSAADGLFARAIAMSGSALANWAHTEDVLEPSSMLAKAAGCHKSSNIKECLKSKTTEEIKKATATFAKYVIKTDRVNLAHFHPRLDGKFLNGSNFDEAIKNTPKREIFIGLCSNEHSVFAIESGLSGPQTKYVPVPLKKAKNYTREDFVEIVNILLGTKEIFKENSQEVAEKIINFYESQTVDNQQHFYLNIYSKLFSDISFNIASIREAKKKAAAGYKVYFYIYNFVHEKMKHPLLDGAGHASDLLNFFGPIFNMPALPLEGNVAKVQKTMIDLFVNFVKNGKPTSGNLEVPQIKNSSKVSYIEINAESKIMDSLWEKRVEFWDNLAMEYGYDWPEARRIEKHDEL